MNNVSLFISYAHADTVNRPNVESSWLSELINNIKYDLGVHSGRMPFRILRDVEGVLRVGDTIDDEIGRAIDGCDLGLIFLSKNYCRSEECEAEFTRLLEKGKRLILVEIDEVWATENDHPLARHKPAVDRVLTQRFWVERDGHFVQFGFPLPSMCKGEVREAFDAALQNLVADLRKHKKDILALVPAEEREARDPPGRHHVYLATPTSDAKALTDKLERTFVEKGFGVLRPEHLDVPESPVDLEVQIRTCELFVQVFGVSPGKKLFGDEGDPMVIAQNRAAAAAGVAALAWRMPDFDLEECNEAYADFLRGTISHLVSFEEFEQYCVKKVEDRIRVAESKERRSDRLSGAEGAAPPLVAIDAAAEDQELSRKIHEELGKHVMVNALSYEDPDINELNEAAADNDAIVLVYGENASGQKRATSHFKLFRRLVWDAERRRFQIAVGDAAPPTAPPCPRGPGVHLIQVRDTVDPASMQGFLDSLGVSGEQDP